MSKTRKDKLSKWERLASKKKRVAKLKPIDYSKYEVRTMKEVN